MGFMSRLCTVGVTTALLGATALLGGCAAYLDGSIFQDQFWEAGPLLTGKNNLAELGVAELAQGRYAEAEMYFGRALKSDPRDVQALLGLGILFQNTGRTIRARQMYEAILAIRPSRSEQSVVWASLTPRPVSEIASMNLNLIESRSPSPVPVMQPVQNRNATGQVQWTTSPQVKQVATEPMTPVSGGGGDNVAVRFKILATLRDQGLIAADEYKVRRQANIGALLPLTSPPAAAGLDRPVPALDAVVGRLRAINRALELRALTVGQHAAERTTIVDGLLPAAPVSVANPGAPPSGLMAAADSVRWLEKLKAMNLISNDEYSRERMAIEKAMTPAPMRLAAGSSSTMAASGGSGGSAVHLASYRSQKDAERGWVLLRRAHKDLLSGLSSEVSRVDLGAGKGIYYRLKAGPLAGKTAADRLCRSLKKRRQYCEPSLMNRAG